MFFVKKKKRKKIFQNYYKELHMEIKSIATLFTKIIFNNLPLFSSSDYNYGFHDKII